MENTKAASASWPTKKRSLGWVTEWSVETFLLQFTRTAIKTNLPPDLEMGGPVPVLKRWASILWPRNMFFTMRFVCSLSFLSCTSTKGTLPNLKLLTPAQAANAIALQNAMQWFCAVGAGPAFLAGLLRGRGRVRWALAAVGLACAVAKHCISTWLLGFTIVVAAPNDDLLFLSLAWAPIFVFYAVAYVTAVHVLLRPPRWEEY